MKNFCLLFLAILCFKFTYSQEIRDTISSEISQTKNNNATSFNDWHITVYGGVNFLQNSDLVSWGAGRFTPGYDFQLQLTKEITHSFGIALMGQLGKTNQYAKGPHYQHYAEWEAKTSYYAVSLLGDLNFSNLLRRSDVKRPFRWALHGYAGAGILAYTIDRRTINGGPVPEWEQIWDQKFNDKSIFAQVGFGLKYKLSHKFDVEFRTLYFMSGDESFDGSLDPDPGNFTLADLEEGRDDNMITTSLGLSYKIGRKKESLQWHNPLKNSVESTPSIPTPCLDDDNDGVCNLYDKCPNTPEGIRVDGGGCPLDADNDGVHDSVDECPTIPGPPTNNGCPIPIVEVSVGSIADNLTNLLQGIEFDYNSDVIREASYSKLNAAFTVLDAHPTYKFYVEGHTDAAGSVAYNKDLSNRRAASVVRYLINKGINSSQLFPIGKGKSELKHPECDPVTNCPAWKNLENRRVVFKPYGEAIEGVEYKK